MTTSQIQIPSSELIDITLLKADNQNPNRMTQQQHEALRQSIERYGFIVPIITNKNLLIADGEQRWTVAKSMGMTQVPVIRLPIEDVDRRLLRQVLNKLRGEHELIVDAHEFDLIVNAGHEQDLKQLLLLNDSQIERYLAEIHEPQAEDYEIPEIEKVQTDIKRGDVFRLGNHRLMCGDATNKDNTLSLIENAEIHMIFTDPPYGVGFDKHVMAEDAGIIKANIMRKKGGSCGFKNWGEIEGDKTLKTYLAFIDIATELFYTKSWYLCAPSRYLGEILSYLESAGVYFATPIVWVKEHWVMSWERYHAQHENIIFCGEGAHPTGNKSIWYGKHNESTVWQIQRDNTNAQALHPTQKPLELIKRALMNSSQQNSNIYDGFGGSGSTLIACEQTGRTCYMMEIDPRYCQIIINRWEAYTKQKAVKISENNVSQNSN